MQQRDNVTSAISFNKTGYDPFLDYLKGLCILCIILNHCMPEAWLSNSLFCLWGRPAVPIFLLIQVFHAYKHGQNVNPTNWKKLWKRILFPFLFTELFIITAISIQHLISHTFSVSTIIWTILPGGPGGYYPWIYVQFALLLPLLKPLIDYVGVKWSCVLFILVSQLLEIICSAIHLPEFVYRLLFFRYIFIVFLGYLVATKGILINLKTLSIAILSMTTILIFTYTGLDFRPCFYNAYGETHWMCYFYMFVILMLLFRFFFSQNILVNLIKRMGKCSYEIFLCQLVFFSLFDVIIIDCLSFLGNALIINMAFIILSLLICCIPILLLKKKE